MQILVAQELLLKGLPCDTALARMLFILPVALLECDDGILFAHRFE